MVARPPRRRAQRVPGVVGTLMTNMAVELALRGARRRLRARQGRRPLRARGARSRAAGCSAAKARATCSRSTGTPPATASSARCRCSRRSCAQRRSARRSCSRASTLFPQTLINVRLAARAATGRRTAALRRAAQPRSTASSDGSGRVLIRPSGTEPVRARDGRGARRGAVEALRGAAGGCARVVTASAIRDAARALRCVSPRRFAGRRR